MAIMPQGANYDEMKAGLDLMDKINDADEILELDAADYRTVIAKVKAHKWPIMHKRFLDFMDDIIDAPEVEDKDAA